MKIGILGGTFDPIHKGHLHLAHEAIQALDLDKVLLVPAACSPFKQDQETTDSTHRLNMIRLALEDQKCIEVSEIELERKNISYTIDTLVELKKQYPKPHELFLIMGSDTFNEIDKWERAENIVDYCRIVVAKRPDYISEERRGTVFISSEMKPYSATGVREQLQMNKKPDGLPYEVYQYIREQGLYGYKQK